MARVAWDGKAFGARLRELRAAKGMTQAALGEGAGCHANTVAKMERGEQEPVASVLLSLCQALGCTPNELFRPAASQPTETPKPGRPAGKKAPPVAEKPKRPRGRPRKEKG